MPRKITVSTLSLRREGGSRAVEANVASAERLIERAAALKPDIVCLPETFPTVGLTTPQAVEAAQSVPGPITERIGALARRFGMNVVCPLLERKGERVYNAGVLLDRHGRVTGAYHKIHPTIDELEAGVTPGHRVEVFETDFGRVGVLICFDIMFPDRWREAKEGGAEVVFWPSAYEGGLPLQARACDYECYVVSSTPVWGCHILDITGYPIASAGHRHGQDRPGEAPVLDGLQHVETRRHPGEVRREGEIQGAVAGGGLHARIGRPGGDGGGPRGGVRAGDAAGLLLAERGGAGPGADGVIFRRAHICLLSAMQV